LIGVDRPGAEYWLADPESLEAKAKARSNDWVATGFH
jgi:hypothetical protein